MGVLDIDIFWQRFIWPRHILNISIIPPHIIPTSQPDCRSSTSTLLNAKTPLSNDYISAILPYLRHIYPCTHTDTHTYTLLSTHTNRSLLYSYRERCTWHGHLILIWYHGCGTFNHLYITVLLHTLLYWYNFNTPKLYERDIIYGVSRAIQKPIYKYKYISIWIYLNICTWFAWKRRLTIRVPISPILPVYASIYIYINIQTFKKWHWGPEWPGLLWITYSCLPRCTSRGYTTYIYMYI